MGEVPGPKCVGNPNSVSKEVYKREVWGRGSRVGKPGLMSSPRRAALVMSTCRLGAGLDTAGLGQGQS